MALHTNVCACVYEGPGLPLPASLGDPESTPYSVFEGFFVVLCCVF